MHKEDSDEDFDIKEDDMEDMPSEWVLCPSVIRSEDNYNEDSDDNAGEVDSTKRRRHTCVVLLPEAIRGATTRRTTATSPPSTRRRAPLLP